MSSPVKNMKELKRLLAGTERFNKQPRPEPRPRQSDTVASIHIAASAPSQIYRIIAVPDIHFPHHDPVAVAITAKYIELEQPDAVVLMGDVLNAEALSRHDTEAKNIMTRRFLLQTEIEMSMPFQQHCVDNAGAVYWLGSNHEEGRLRRLINANPGLSELPVMDPKTFFGIHEDIRYVPEKQRLKIGCASFEHGHNVINSRGSKHIANTILERRPGTNTFVGHWHCFDAKGRVFYYDDSEEGRVRWAVSCGHLSLVTEHWHYAKLPNWSKGFVEIAVKGDDLWWTFHHIANGRLLCKHGEITG